MPGEVDAVVGDAVLGVVVGTDFLGAGATADSRAASGLKTSDPLLLLDLPELGAEEVETDLAVSLLVALLRRDGGDPCGLVDQSDGGGDFVDILPAVATGTEELPLEVLVPNHDLLRIDLGQNSDTGGRGVDTAL